MAGDPVKKTDFPTLPKELTLKLFCKWSKTLISSFLKKLNHAKKHKLNGLPAANWLNDNRVEKTSNFNGEEFLNVGFLQTQ